MLCSFFVALTNFLIMRVYSNKQASIHNLALSFAYPFPFQPFIQLLSLFLSLLVTSFSFSIFLFLLPLLFSFRFKLSLFSIPYFWFPFSPSNTCKTYSTVFVSSTSFIVLFPSFLCLCLSPSPRRPPIHVRIFQLSHPLPDVFVSNVRLNSIPNFHGFYSGFRVYAQSHCVALVIFLLQVCTRFKPLFLNRQKNASDYPDQLPFQRPTWKSALCTLAQMPLVHYSHGGLQKFAPF